MSKHTAGPWVAVGSTVYFSNKGGISLERAPDPEANARLIAAAPDLLIALKQVNDCLVKCLTGGEVSAKLAGKSIEAAALLIERIEGEPK